MQFDTHRRLSMRIHVRMCRKPSLHVRLGFLCASGLVYGYCCVVFGCVVVLVCVGVFVGLFVSVCAPVRVYVCVSCIAYCVVVSVSCSCQCPRMSM